MERFISINKQIMELAGFEEEGPDIKPNTPPLIDKDRQNLN